MSNYTRNTLTGDLAPVNSELEKIQESLADKLDREPSAGQANQMTDTLDMNSQRLTNLTAPQNENDAARRKDVDGVVAAGLPDQTDNAGNYLTTDGSAASWGALGTAALADLTTSPTDTTTGSVLKVGDFGIGETGAPPVLPDIESTSITVGFYGTNAGSFTGTNPTNRTVNSVVQLRDSSRQYQMLFNVDQRFLFRVDQGSWSEVYHSGNSINALDYGLGETGVPPVLSDIESTSIATGFYGTNAGSFTGTNPTNRTSNSVIQFRDVAIQYQMMFNIDQRFLFRVDQGSWVEMYHSGNTNFTEFGGDGVNDVIARGEAIGSTTAYFYLPVNLNSIPSSISVTTPFRVTDTNSVVKASGVTAVALTTNSSNKLVRLQVTGLSGLVAGESLELRTDTSTAKITVVP